MSSALERLPRALADRYRIERELGRGGMATVYLADDLKHGRKVAIKVLLPELAEAIGQERFLREIEIVARLTHPHILPLYDSGAADGRLYYVTPYIPGGSLRDRLARERMLPLEEALRLATEIASALGHAHQQGLVHRDIKPENVLLSEGIAIVADFGIARAVASRAERTITTASAVVGTPVYMAPEQAAGGTDVDGRADLYSLGCVLYEMIAGQPPFTGPAASLAYQHLSLEPRPVTDLRPRVPRALASVIARALAKLPSDRFATAAQLAEALVAASTGGPTPTPHPRAGAVEVPAHLPRQRTRFIGREQELAECARALGDARILTLTGTVGCGKSRLALRLAESMLESFPDGVWYVDLAPLPSCERVALSLATALEVREEPGTPTMQSLTERLRERRALIVLDNCEHVLGAAAALADALASSTADLKLIVTSREPLGVEGERLYTLHTLPVPSPAADPQAIEASEAVRLFLDRARVIDATFALTPATAGTVAEICRRLDGIPLAIELAAARVKVLTVEDISARLDDRFRLLTGGSRTALPHHQTLSAAIQWSYDQISEAEQRLFRLLAVFAGGWTLEAAVTVGGGDADEFQVLDLLTHLIDKSLVTLERDTGGGSRYRMLETVRQYAGQRLAETAEAGGARARHLEFFRALAERVEPRLSGPEQTAWSARLLQEQENLMGAHAWCGRSPGHGEDGLRLVGALRRYWLFVGLLELGYRITVEALERADAQARTAARAKALYAAASLAYFIGRYPDSHARASEALEIARETGSEELECDALRELGLSCNSLGDLAGAKAHLHVLVALLRRRGDSERLGRGLNALAEVLRSEGDLEAAEPLYEETLALFRENGDLENSVIALINLVAVAVQRGAGDRARTLMLECLSMGVPTSLQVSGNLLDEIGAIFALRGEWPRAALLVGAAEAQLIKTGARRDAPDERFIRPLMERAHAALGEVAFAAAMERGGALGADAALARGRGWLEEEPGERAQDP